MLIKKKKEVTEYKLQRFIYASENSAYQDTESGKKEKKIRYPPSFMHVSEHYVGGLGLEYLVAVFVCLFVLVLFFVSYAFHTLNLSVKY